MKDPVIEVLGKSISDFANFFGIAEIEAPIAVPGERRYLTFPEKGIGLILDDGDVARTLQLFNAGVSKRYSQYQGPLPNQIGFLSSRVDVRREFGNPERASDGGPGKGIGGAMMYPWDLFHVDGKRFHFEYAPNGEFIRLVSVEELPEWRK